MTLKEALSFIAEKEESLTKQSELMTRNADIVKNKIRSLYGLLEKLMALPTIEEELNHGKKTRKFLN